MPVPSTFEKLTAKALYAAKVKNTTLIHVVDTTDTSQDPDGSSYKMPLTDLTRFQANSVFVDTDFGSDTLGVYGLATQPFATLQAAIENIPTSETLVNIYVHGQAVVEDIDLDQFVNVSTCDIHIFYHNATHRSDAAATFSKTSGNGIRLHLHDVTLPQSLSFAIVNATSTDLYLHNVTASITSASTMFQNISSLNDFGGTLTALGRIASINTVRMYNGTYESTASQLFSGNDLLFVNCTLETASTHAIELNGNFYGKGLFFKTTSTAILATANASIYIYESHFECDDEALACSTYDVDGCAIGCSGMKSALTSGSGAITIIENYFQNTSAKWII